MSGGTENACIQDKADSSIFVDDGTPLIPYAGAREQVSQFKLACNTHENGLAAASMRHYVKKDVDWQYKTKDGEIKYTNKIGNPSELIRRAVDCVAKHLTNMLMEIDENTIKLEDIEAVEIPEAEVVSESHGESMFPIHKLIDEIKPNSFTSEMAENYFSSHSGAEMPKDPVCKGFVEPNEVLNKVKPRLVGMALGFL